MMRTMAAETTTTFRSELRRRVAWALLLLLPAALGACSSCGSSKGPSPSASAKVAALAPVPAPAGLLAELYVDKPGDTWTSVRKLVGGPTRLLPAGFQMLAATLLGLPPDAAGLIDDLPVRGVLVLDDQRAPRVVLGLHVRSGKEVVASLSTGAKARFHARHDKKSGVTLLEPVKGKASSDVALGVVGHYLLCAKVPVVVEAAGPYVARTLPTKKSPPGPIVAVIDHKALSGPVASHLAGGWKSYKKRLKQSSHDTQAKQGRPADFADPAAALMGASSAVGGAVDVLKSSKQLTVVIEPREGRLSARAELTPGKTGAAAELVEGMSVGSLDALTRLPGSTALALASHTDAESRKAWADSTATAIEKLLGKRLTSPDKKKLEKTLKDLAKGRGDNAALGVAVGKQPSVLLRSSVTDADAFQSGARGVFQLLRVPALAKPLHQFIGKATVVLSKTRVKGIDGSVQQAKLKLARKKRDKHEGLQLGSKPIDFLWTVKDGVAFGAAAREPEPGLLSLLDAGAKSSASLGGQASVRAAVKRLGDNAAFALFLDPAALSSGSARKGPPAPVLIGFGRSNGRGWVNADVSQAAIQSVVRFTMMRRR